jgi:hypothetical protein
VALYSKCTWPLTFENFCLPEFATSSVGKLRGFTPSFLRSLRTGAVGGDEARVMHVYPSLGQMMDISLKGEWKEKAWEHEDEMHMRGPADW